MKKKAVLKITLTVVTILFIAFIFSNSLQSGDDSGKKSDAVAGVVGDIMPTPPIVGDSGSDGEIIMPDDSVIAQIKIDFWSPFVRKMAHICEYALLGLLLYVTAKAYDVKTCLIIASLLGIIVPVLDEVIQHFVPGRTMAITDMLLDFGGVLLGFAFSIAAVYFGACAREKRQAEKSETDTR